MIIRKLFKFEGAHKVFNCTSKRCSYSNHGHSYKVELFFSAKGLDNGQMLVDFGLFKNTIKDFIDSFDHSYSMWNKMPEQEKRIQKLYSDRWIDMPCSPSAESYALMFLFVIDKIIKSTEFRNGEQEPVITSVRVHETDTGYAEAFREDLEWVDYTLRNIEFSQGIQEEWGNKWWFNSLVDNTSGAKIYFNPNVKQQI